jgi:serine/threonine protein kinase
MEFYPCSLDRLLADCDKHAYPLRGDLVLGWLRGLVEGLYDLHVKYGVVHRDVKPNNIMFQMPGENRRYAPASLLPSDEMVLIDFGTVCRIGERGQLEVLRGQDPCKDPYFYPADAGDTTHPRPPFTPAADVYGLGQVMLEIAKVVPPRERGLLEDVGRECLQPVNTRPTAADVLLRLSPSPRVFGPVPAGPVANPPLTAGGEGEPTGYPPGAHQDFVGRQFVRTALDTYHEERWQKKQGGIFVVVGPPGIGKTALLTQLARMNPALPRFFFSYSERRVGADAMVRALFQQLCQAFQIQAQLPADTRSYTADHLGQLLEQAASRPGGIPGRMLVCVDALDECEDPSEALRLIPTAKLPSGILLVLSTRPEVSGRSILPLLPRDAKKVEIDPLSAENLDDVRRYFRQQLAGLVSDGQALQMARNCGGLFLIAVALCGDVLHHGVSVAEAIQATYAIAAGPRGGEIFRSYTWSWQRRCQQFPEELLKELVAVLNVTRGWICQGEIKRILKWSERNRKTPVWDQDERTERMIVALSWFLEDQRRDGRVLGDGDAVNYRVRHKTVHEYLATPAPTGLGLGEGKQHEMHRCFGRHYLDRAEERDYKQRRAGWAKVDVYGRLNAVYHLLASMDREATEQGADLLTCPEYLQATLGDEPSDEPY